MGVLSLLFTAAYVGKFLGLAITWTIVFVIGSSASATYLVLSPLALSERLRNRILFAKVKRRTVFLATAYAPIVAAISYWIYQAGSVEALPVFPYFIGIFYAWILGQAYFIANPVTHAMIRIEKGLVGKSLVKKITRTFGITVLFLPIAPIAFGIWEISSWANRNYMSISGASTDILSWTLAITMILVATYLLTARWGWKNIKNGRPEAAVFAGGTFAIVWAYLLYRAANMLMGIVTQNQTPSPAIDVGLMAISIFGAMQTFARKAVNLADRKWEQMLPFLVFSFGSVYAVAQFYFIIQGTYTRAGLSAIINGAVFAVGIVILMLLLRTNLKVSNAGSVAQPETSSSEPADSPPAKLTGSNETPQSMDDSSNFEPTGLPEASQESDAIPEVQNTERPDLSYEDGSSSDNQ